MRSRRCNLPGLRHRFAEPVLMLRALVDAGSVFCDELVSICNKSRVGRAENDLNRTCGLLAGYLLAENPNQQIFHAITIEVAGGEPCAKAVVLLGFAFHA